MEFQFWAFHLVSCERDGNVGGVLTRRSKFLRNWMVCLYCITSLLKTYISLHFIIYVSQLSWFSMDIRLRYRMWDCGTILERSPSSAAPLRMRSEISSIVHKNMTNIIIFNSIKTSNILYTNKYLIASFVPFLCNYLHIEFYRMKNIVYLIEYV